MLPLQTKSPWLILFDEISGLNCSKLFSAINGSNNDDDDDNNNNNTFTY